MLSNTEVEQMADILHTCLLYGHPSIPPDTPLDDRDAAVSVTKAMLDSVGLRFEDRSKSSATN